MPCLAVAFHTSSTLSIEENMLSVVSNDMDSFLAHGPHAVKVNQQHGHYVDEHFPTHPQVIPEIGWEQYKSAIQTHDTYPPVDVIRCLIQMLG